MTKEYQDVQKAVEAITKEGFSCFPLGDKYRSPLYQFDTATEKMVAESGCYLEWLDTFKGGCWHVIPMKNK